jgi:hypothetical protein
VRRDRCLKVEEEDVYVSEVEVEVDDCAPKAE